MTTEGTSPATGKKSGFVAIAGRPNAGKSTLLNQVLGSQLSIVTPKAQTTRERVLGILTEEAQGQIVFIDTPGIHRAKDGGINEYMVSEAREALEAASVIWYLVDPSSEPKHEEVVLELLSRALAKADPKPPVFVLYNKMDWKKMPPLEKKLDARFAELGLTPAKVMRISALTGKGVIELLEATWALVPDGPFYYPDPEQISDRPMRFFAAEKIREQLFRLLGEEIPYSCAVEIEKYDEEVKPPRIEAVIHVERDSQKGMVIGKGGTKIKEIGTAARATIEEFVGTQVFLGLRVHVLKDWTKDREAMKRLGYLLPEGGR